MRESIASALSASLQDFPVIDCPVTRLHAFSKAPRLSTCLWRLKYANDPSSFAETVRLIARHLSTKRFTLRSSVRLRSSEAALREWLNEGCRTCLGAGELIVADLKVTCLACDGHGKHRFSDKERGSHGKLIQAALQIISRYDAIPGPVMRFELER